MMCNLLQKESRLPEKEFFSLCQTEVMKTHLDTRMFCCLLLMVQKSYMEIIHHIGDLFNQYTLKNSGGLTQPFQDRQVYLIVVSIRRQNILHILQAFKSFGS